MTIEILSIGNELLLGETVDTNATWIARRLAAEGITVARKTTVGDDVALIRDALDGALRRSGTVICTGGLGPTRDDMTRHALAAVYERALVLDEAWIDTLRARWARRGSVMPESNCVQGEHPAGSMLLPNARGSAPCIVMDDDVRGMTVLLPGVPSEMRALMDEQVVPLLHERLRPAAAIVSHMLRTAGLAEAALAERIDDLVTDIAPLSIAFLPHVAGVDLRITGPASAPAESSPAASALVERLCERLGAHVYARDESDLADVVGRVMTERSLTLALAESCTGGLVAKRLSDGAGASAFLCAGFVTYANAAKRDVLGVRVDTLAMHGAVSEQCAREMAEGARRAGEADVGASITGIAGPGGGTEDKPVGTVWIAVAHADGTAAKLLRLTGDRGEVRERSAQALLDMLRRSLT